MKKIKLNRINKGTILQIVLIVFLVLILNLNLVLITIVESARGIERSKKLNDARLLELTILRYYKETILNDILFSNEINLDNYTIKYTVDDMGSYYYIVTTVIQNDIEYSFTLDINLETLIISSFDYQ